MNTQLFTDKLAISLSAICVLHCLFMPSILILSSWLVAFSINNEFIHYAILIVAIPVSAFALVRGYKTIINCLILFVVLLAYFYYLLLCSLQVLLEK
tara:strand:+ start:174 stop:464 length:291 start_codon:yes stop_codon:yes gene_type:complete